MAHEDCIFCKIITGDIPSAVVYEDDEVLAFLDISQVTKGHTLVIPKAHVINIYETSESIASALFARIPKIANGMKDTLQPEGINVLSNTGEAAGQSVFHLHVHLIPRYGKEDGFQPTWETHSDDYTQDTLQALAKDIHHQIN